MKTCGYCNKEYDESESKCPVCGSTMLKMDHSTSGQAEYDRIEAEIKRKRQTRSAIIIGAAVCVLIVLIVGITMFVGFINDPQRDIDKEAKQLYTVAQEYIDAGDYESALVTADRISSQWSRYNKVDELKEAAVKGQLNKSIGNFEASGDYEAVIEYINKYIVDVSSDKEIEMIYENAVLEYKKVVIAKADEYLEKKEFNEAVNLLTKAAILVNSDGELEAKKIECSKAEMSNQISIYKTQSNYEDIIKLINDNLDIVNNDADILVELRNSESLYVKAVIADAATAYDKDGYEAAISVINDGLTLLPEDSDLVAEKEAYEICAPVDLTTLSSYSEYGDVKVFEGRKDTLGNYYKTGFETLHYNYYSYKVFDIGKQYNTLTAVGFVRNADKGYSTGSAKVKIYGDDKLLFSKTVTSDMKPFEIELNITGVVDLKIEMMGSFNGWDGMYAAIGNVMLQKSK